MIGILSDVEFTATECLQMSICRTRMYAVNILDGWHGSLSSFPSVACKPLVTPDYSQQFCLTHICRLPICALF